MFRRLPLRSVTKFKKVTGIDGKPSRFRVRFFPKPYEIPTLMTSRFIREIQASLADETFRKVTLGKFRGALAELEHVYVRKVSLKEGERLNFVYRYPDHDSTQNHSIQEANALLSDWIGTQCYAATLLTSTQRQQLLFNRRGKPRWATVPADQKSIQEDHDRSKKRILKDEEFLKPLGILDPQGKPKVQMGDKYRQIHHFIELLAPSVRSLPRDKPLRVVDMGSGKGYLTFALCAFLAQEHFEAEVLGIELRSSLVDLCNRIASECGFRQLRFAVGDISKIDLESTDLLVALHACDTATDEAIFRGISAGAGLILAAPCCHKEIRPQLKSPDSLKPLFRHGIQVERMAEMITDTLRTMYLEASGYDARIQEFIALEHTNKNLIIVATRNPKNRARDQLFEEAALFASLFGIEHQKLGDLLQNR
jgi:SAM-dependent methyltransferase